MPMNLNDVSLVPLDPDTDIVRVEIPDIVDADGTKFTEVVLLCCSTKGSPKRLVRAMERGVNPNGRITRMNVTRHKRE